MSLLAKALLNPRTTFGMARQAMRLVTTTARERGWRETVRRVVQAPARHGLGTLVRHFRGSYVASLPRPAKLYPVYDRPTTRGAGDILELRVLIVAELSLPQCTKYRVKQKADHVRSLGVPCTILDWGDRRSIRNSLQTHTIAIFYRVPGYPDVLELIDEAKRLGLATFWEVDDLIFDAAVYEANRNVHLLDPELKRGVLYGIPLYRAALQRCDYGLASTETLADAMRAAGVKDAFVIENALDPHTIALAETVRAARVGSPHVTIVYGSGSKAHDADFQQAAGGLIKVLRARAHVRLRIIGHLTLPAEFSEFGDRVQRAPFGSFDLYLEQLGGADISLAPLEDTVFNDAKSNIKYLEASILGLPSVCSPRATFRQVIRPGVNGLLAQTDEEWAAALLHLVDHPDERAAMGRAAFDTVWDNYQPHTIAQRQVEPVLRRFAPGRGPSLRVLTANVFFYPQTFGGATVVAEKVASLLNERPDCEIAVFTSYGDRADPYELFRYEVEGLPVFAVKIPETSQRELEYANPRMAEIFAEVLAAFRPDVVHLHSVQGLSATLGDACEAAGVPYVITLHDAWWICERQFMVTGEGKYCFQKEIDRSVCNRCVQDSWFRAQRDRYVRGVLDRAALLLSPSEFHRQLHISNGVSPDRIRVNRNGILAPRRPRAGRPNPGLVRFGFVGGLGPIKGLDLIRKAFRDIKSTNYELVVVDNTQNLGFSSMDASDWRVSGTVRVVPAYTQDTIDSFFDQIDVLLFPSQWKESFGLTVREALIRDVWVIVTEAGGAVEDVVDGENGTIIPITEDHQPLKRAIQVLLDNPERLEFVNKNKGQIATFTTQADELHTFLAQVAARHPVQQASGTAFFAPTAGLSVLRNSTSQHRTPAGTHPDRSAPPNAAVRSVAV